MQRGITRLRRHQTGNLYSKDATEGFIKQTNGRFPGRRRENTSNLDTAAGVLSPSTGNRTNPGRTYKNAFTKIKKPIISKVFVCLFILFDRCLGGGGFQCSFFFPKTSGEMESAGRRSSSPHRLHHVISVEESNFSARPVFDKLPPTPPVINGG